MKLPWVYFIVFDLFLCRIRFILQIMIGIICSNSLDIFFELGSFLWTRTQLSHIELELNYVSGFFSSWGYRLLPPPPLLLLLLLLLLCTLGLRHLLLLSSLLSYVCYMNFRSGLSHVKSIFLLSTPSTSPQRTMYLHFNYHILSHFQHFYLNHITNIIAIALITCS